MRIFAASVLFILLSIGLAIGQLPSSAMYVQVQKFQSLKRVLYIAAHPDDENTRALAWLSLGEKAETAYLSLTRGDGGQNLIGDELGAPLGILRSQELLQARAIDGSKQYFSRAVDFGYSRSAEESFNKWNKDEILADVVQVIRQFKPDVIITRFPPDERAGHGHHTASTLLAIEAFEKAADVNFLPDQVRAHGTWQTTSIYWNASNWWNQGIDSIARNNPDYLIFDIGEYNPLLGMSYNEIGTLARSQHKCQGFGSLIERGSRIEYFQHLGGVKLKNSFFEMSQRSWTSVVSKSLEKDFKTLVDKFNFTQPEKNVPLLLKIYGQLMGIQDKVLRAEKIALCEQLIAQCLGVHIDMTMDDYSYVGGSEVKLMLNVINRSSMDVKLAGVVSYRGEMTNDIPLTGLTNELKQIPIFIKTEQQPFQHYWLASKYENIFNVVDAKNIGNPEADPSLHFSIILEVNGRMIKYPTKAIYKWGDPSFGERQRDLVATPNFSVNFEEDVIVVNGNESKTIRMKLHNFKGDLADELAIEPPKGWVVEPSVLSVQSSVKHEEKWYSITLTPTDKAVSGELILLDKAGQPVQAMQEISYDHIPTQVLFSVVELPLKKMNVSIKKGLIGYIKGVQDGVPAAIQRLGFEIEMIELKDLATIDLNRFQTVVVGIRAYNVSPELINYNEKIGQYIHQGGNFIVQYNTASAAVKKMKIGPLPFEIGRDRVTEEDASVTFLEGTHPLLTYPNMLAADDFDNWVQERGLYFAEKYEADFTPLLSWHDTGKSPAKGGLIVASYGKGQMIYTGISFFRQLPAGVEGAYKLWSNMLSYPPHQK
jgi:LmbE family N-acetylglucosaminyl deacetylase